MCAICKPLPNKAMPTNLSPDNKWMSPATKRSALGVPIFLCIIQQKQSNKGPKDDDEIGFAWHHFCWTNAFRRRKVIYTSFIFFVILIHWGRVAHICVSNLTIIALDNGLSPGRRQAIIWTNAEILLIGHFETEFSGILIKIEKFSYKRMHLNVSSAKLRPLCLGLNVFMLSLGTAVLYMLSQRSFFRVDYIVLVNDVSKAPFNNE